MLQYLAKRITGALSVIDHLPGLGSATPPLNGIPDDSELAARKENQELAIRCAAETERALAPDWTERRAARFMRDWFADHGVHSYFHRPLVFFGERTRYADFTALSDLRPTNRVLGEDSAYILDAGPIINGTACDISMSGVMGDVARYAEARALLAAIRLEIPELVRAGHDGKTIWTSISDRINAHGFDAIHHDSSYSFFGHRLNGTNHFPLAHWLAERGKQTYVEFFARGLAGQLWSGLRRADLTGIWAVEPHIGGQDFGIKFEESLVITPSFTGWLRDFAPRD